MVKCMICGFGYLLLDQYKMDCLGFKFVNSLILGDFQGF